jgi:hypothetical protein
VRTKVNKAAKLMARGTRRAMAEFVVTHSGDGIPSEYLALMAKHTSIRPKHAQYRPTKIGECSKSGNADYGDLRTLECPPAPVSPRDRQVEE